MRLSGDDPVALDRGPGAVAGSSEFAAWWTAAGGGSMVASAAVDDEAPGSAQDLLASPLLAPASVEVASTADDVWFLTVDAPDGDEAAPASLVLVRRHGDGDPTPVTAIAPDVTRSGEEYDITALDGSTVLVAWFGDGVIRTQTVSV